MLNASSKDENQPEKNRILDCAARALAAQYFWARIARIS
jgi:hypothetical protein